MEADLYVVGPSRRQLLSLGSREDVGPSVVSIGKFLSDPFLVALLAELGDAGGDLCIRDHALRVGVACFLGIPLTGGEMLNAEAAAAGPRGGKLKQKRRGCAAGVPFPCETVSTRGDVNAVVAKVLFSQKHVPSHIDNEEGGVSLQFAARQHKVGEKYVSGMAAVLILEVGQLERVRKGLLAAESFIKEASSHGGAHTGINKCSGVAMGLAVM
jgi:hypothetical protein